MDAKILLQEAEELLKSVKTKTEYQQDVTYRHIQTLTLLAIANSLGDLNYRLLEWEETECGVHSG